VPIGQRGVYVPLEERVLQDLYWERGLSIPKVAEELGVALRTVHRRMMEYGIPRRNVGPRPADGRLLKRPAEILTLRFLKYTYERKRMTTVQIAEQTGFSHRTVTYWLRHAGIPIRESGFARQYHIERKDLIKLRRQGVGPKQVAAEYGCSVTTVERALRRYGLVGYGLVGSGPGSRV
jgi:transposase